MISTLREETDAMLEINVELKGARVDREVVLVPIGRGARLTTAYR